MTATNEKDEDGLRRVRVSAKISVVLRVPPGITLEEIQRDFKANLRGLQFYVSDVRLRPEGFECEIETPTPGEVQARRAQRLAQSLARCDSEIKHLLRREGETRG